MEHPLINVLILCGGQSSRMGTPKHLLQLHDSEYVFQTLLRRCRQVCPESSEYFVSLRDRSCSTLTGIRGEGPASFGLLFDSDTTEEDIGPAAGLLAAHHRRPTCHWLVLACDYPLLGPEEIGHLLANHRGHLSCLENQDGWPEPLLAIWSPAALRQLQENVGQGITGPKHVVRQLRAHLVRPLESKSLFNANTVQEWNAAVALASQEPVVDKAIVPLE